MDDTEIVTASSGTVALLNESEINQQIATAHKYPRSIARFRKTVQEMVTLSDAIAAECIYSLPRDGKVIEGPSARFAEVIASAWGNSRAGARVVSDEGDFVTAQGVFHDLESNTAITYEVQRRITGKGGKRYGADMIGVTANAACSIALRNAILKGVPKAFWAEMYEGAKLMAKGDVKTLPNRRAEVMKDLMGYGIKPEQVYAKLGIEGMADIGLDHLLTLRGLVTAIKEGDTTPEQAFEPADGSKPPPAVVPRKTDADKTSVDKAAEVQAAGLAADQAAARAEDKTAKQKADPATGEIPDPHAAAPVAPGMATGGERQLILAKIKAKRLDLLGFLDEQRMSHLLDPMTLAGMTSGDFKQLNAALT